MHLSARCYGKSFYGKGGDGRASFNFFWYDKFERDCKPFVYGGVGLSYETDNVFTTKEECYQACKLVIGGKENGEYTKFPLSDYELQKYIGRHISYVRNELERFGYLVHVVRTGRFATGEIPVSIPGESVRLRAIVTYDGRDDRVTNIVQREY
ncbi:unnamed protein product [Didymodactylos carnosus]|uniref:BPTI/Kunitz inhibitor domain-containing protein n=2 Tax=Didymodactylos carnosus TaxID=1234261 RepID=A0A814U9C0_9BILA|nr:unnamed protein product [Didymodactylos carnosus]CAF3935149.1 unnamed protein product [Didymodactylos carnosus]